jgi:hypothetical protein
MDISSSQKVSEKPDRFKKIAYLWYNCKTCQVYFLKAFPVENLIE